MVVRTKKKDAREKVNRLHIKLPNEDVLNETMSKQTTCFFHKLQNRHGKVRGDNFLALQNITSRSTPLLHK